MSGTLSFRRAVVDFLVRPREDHINVINDVTTRLGYRLFPLSRGLIQEQRSVFLCFSFLRMTDTSIEQTRESIMGLSFFLSRARAGVIKKIRCNYWAIIFLKTQAQSSAFDLSILLCVRRLIVRPYTVLSKHLRVQATAFFFTPANVQWKESLFLHRWIHAHTHPPFISHRDLYILSQPYIWYNTWFNSPEEVERNHVSLKIHLEKWTGVCWQCSWALLKGHGWVAGIESHYFHELSCYLGTHVHDQEVQDKYPKILTIWASTISEV